MIDVVRPGDHDVVSHLDGVRIISVERTGLMLEVTGKAATGWWANPATRQVTHLQDIDCRWTFAWAAAPGAAQVVDWTVRCLALHLTGRTWLTYVGSAARAAAAFHSPGGGIVPVPYRSDLDALLPSLD